MQLYLDSSALVKLAVVEPETAALKTYLNDWMVDARMTAALARTELVRAVALHRSSEVIENARDIMARLALVALTNRLLDAAATIAQPRLRTLDAIHLAAAMTAPNLRAMVTYDQRLADAAAVHGITVAHPGVN